MASVAWKKANVQTAGAMVKHNGKEERVALNHSNKDIDKSKSHLNVYIGADDYAPMFEKVKARIEEVDREHPPLKQSADRVTCFMLETPVPQAITEQGKAEDFLRNAHKVIEDFFGAENVGGTCGHFDEQHEYYDKDGAKQMSLVHGHTLVAAYVEWTENIKKSVKQDNGKYKQVKTDETRERCGINGKHCETRARLRQLNKAMDEMCKREYGISYNTGGVANKEKVEHLKAMSKLKEAEALQLQQLQQLQKERLDLSADNDELTFENNDLAEQKTQLTADNQTLTEQKEQLTADNQALTEQKKASSDEIDALGRTLEGLRATTAEARQNNALALKRLVEGLPDPPERPEGERYADWEKWKVNHHPRDKNGNLLKEGSWKWRKAMEEEHKRHTEHNAPWLEFDRLFQEWWEKAEQVEAVKKLQEQYGSDLSAVAEQKTELDARERQIADKERSLAQRTARFNSEVDEAAEKKVTKYREQAEKAEEKVQRIKDRANDIIDRLNQEHEQELAALKEENLDLKKELGIEEEEVLDLTGGYEHDRGY